MYIQTALKETWLSDCITMETDGLYFRYDTEDSTQKENWGVYCDIQDTLREYGYILEDPYIEHDCISGNVVEYETW